MATTQLQARVRATGKSRRLRREGFVPAVVYGQGIEPEHIALPVSQVTTLLNTGTHGIMKIDIDGADEQPTVMVRDIQQDPIRGDVLHMDFLRISLTEAVQTTVPVVVIDEDKLPGAAVLNQLIYELEIEALPQDLPEAIEVAVAGLEIGDNLMVDNLALPEGVTVIYEDEQPVLQILDREAIALAAEEAEAAAEEEELDLEEEEEEEAPEEDEQA